MFTTYAEKKRLLKVDMTDAIESFIAIGIDCISLFATTNPWCHITKKTDKVSFNRTTAHKAKLILINDSLEDTG